MKRGRMRTASAVTPSARRMAAVGAVAFGVAGLGASAASAATTYGPQKTLATNIQAAAVGVDTTGNVLVSETRSATTTAATPLSRSSRSRRPGPTNTPSFGRVLRICRPARSRLTSQEPRLR